jgi:hypothetical protein
MAHEKTWHIEVGDSADLLASEIWPDGRVVRWKAKADGKGRTFGAHEPATPAPASTAEDDAFVASMQAELERREVAA